jgi:nucleolar protein 56
MTVNNQEKYVIIVETLIGLFAVNEDNEIIGEEIFPLEPNEIVQILEKHRNGEISDKLDKILKKIQDGHQGTVFIISEDLRSVIIENLGIDVTLIEEIENLNHIRKNIFRIAEKHFDMDRSEFLDLNYEVTNILSKRSIRRALAERGALITQTVQLLGELDEMTNILSSRLREWYGLHFPELGRRVRDHEEYAKLIWKIGSRSNINFDKIKQLDFDKRRTLEINRLAETSMGAYISKRGMDRIRNFARRILDMYQYKNELTNYISEITEEIAPNVTTLVGPLLGARLMENAGGLKRLAMLPASTIQVLGAEKAMMRTIKTGAKPPKHGLIFQHPYVHRAPRGERGKRARELAGKIAIAARADYFSGNYIAEELQKELTH